MTDYVDKPRYVINISVSIVTMLGAIAAMLLVFRRVYVYESEMFVAVAGSVMGAATAVALMYCYQLFRHRTPLGEVFLAHSVKDKEIAGKLIEALNEARIKVMTPETVLHVGDRIEDTIRKAIDSSKGVVVIISPNSMGSNWMKKEMAYAKESGKRLFPALVGDVESPSDLAGILYVKMDPKISEGARRLAASVREFCQMPEAEKETPRKPRSSVS